MIWCRLQDYFWPLCSALLINVLLFMGVAYLCRDDAPQREMTVSNPIHLTAGHHSVPAKPATTEQQPSARPEPPQEVPEIPQIPEMSEPEISPEPITDIEVPELQPELSPDLLAAEVPEPVKQPKPKPKKRTERSQKQKPPAKAAPTKTAAASPSAATTPTASAGSDAGKSAGGSPLGDLGSKEFGLGEVDRGPQILKQQKPAYPLVARRRNLTGRVTVKFLVDRHGKVRKPRIVEAHPRGVFEQSVLDSITKWRFKPGVLKGREVATWVVLPIQFRLTGG